jgi:hypothetical protein
MAYYSTYLQTQLPNHNVALSNLAWCEYEKQQKQNAAIMGDIVTVTHIQDFKCVLFGDQYCSQGGGNLIVIAKSLG